MKPFPTDPFGAWIFFVIIGWLMVSFLSTGVLAQNQTLKTNQEDTITLNFINSNLEDVIKGISVITGKRFLLPPNLKSKKINLVTRQPIAVHQVYGVLLSALRSYRLVATENDGITSIVPETEAWAQAKPIQPKSRDSNLVSKVIKLKNASAPIVANIIRPLLSQKGFPLVPNNNNNSIVVVDYAKNIRNLETIITSLDQTEQILPVIFPVTHLSVIEVESALKNMLNTAPLGSTSGYTKPVSENIYADIPNNRLLVRANTTQLIYIAKLIAFIDVPRKSARLIHMYSLKYTNAEHMAKTLRNLLSNPNMTANRQTSNSGASGQNQAKNTANKQSPIVGSMLTLEKSGVNIQADSATNSLIIVAPENLYRNLVEIIQKLDVRRQQLFVEILIADVNGDRLDELGVQWMASDALGSTNQKGVIATTRLDNPSITDVAQNPLNMGSGLSIGIINGQTNIPGVGKIINLGVLARALETHANAKILSSPNLLVLNNEESKLLVGSTIPVVTGQYTQTSGTTGNPFQTIERKDVGVTLRIKPQILDSGAILLDLYQEVSDILSVTEQGPTTSKRSLESKIMLDNEQVMVLGGLISEKINEHISQVPLLGTIPILGQLFTHRKKTHSKSNLMLFIRPTILHDKNEVNALSNQRYKNIYNQQHQLNKSLQGLFDKPSRVLPSPKNMLNIIPQPSLMDQVAPPLSPSDASPPASSSTLPPRRLLTPKVTSSPKTPSSTVPPVIMYSPSSSIQPSQISTKLFSLPMKTEPPPDSSSPQPPHQLTPKSNAVQPTLSSKKPLQPIFSNTGHKKKEKIVPLSSLLYRAPKIKTVNSSQESIRLQKMRELYTIRKAEQ